MLGRWNFLLSILDPHFQGRCGMLVSGSLGLWGVTVSAFPRWEAFSEVDHVTGTFWWKKSWTTWDVPLKGLYTLTLCTTVFFSGLMNHQRYVFFFHAAGRYRPHQNSYFNEPHDSEEYEALLAIFGGTRTGKPNTRIRVHDDVRWHHNTCLTIGNSLWVSLNRRTLMSCTYEWRNIYIYIHHILSCILIHLFLLYIISTCNPKDPYSFLFGKTRCLFMFSKFKTRLDPRMAGKYFRGLLEVESVGRCPPSRNRSHLLVMERPETHLPN